MAINQKNSSWLDGLLGGNKSNLVVKLAPNHLFLAEISKQGASPYIEKLCSYPLSKQIDPNNPHKDIDILQFALSNLVKQNGYVGRDVCILLPNSACASNTYTIPFDVEVGADLKEFKLCEQDKDFWQEFDPEVQDCKSPYFSAQFLAQGDETGTSQMFVSWASQELLNKYINLVLQAKLYPVALVPELQGILNVLVPQLEKVEQQAYFGVLHLARGRSKLFAVSHDRIVTANLNISELDEELVDEIEDVASVEGDFWGEVGSRFGGALRQASLYLQESEGIPAFKTIYVISEAPRYENMLTLLRAHFNLCALRLWEPLNLIPKNQINTASALTSVPNQSLWASLVGGGIIGLSKPTLKVKSEAIARYQLNLHPQINALYSNRIYKNTASIFNRLSIGLIAAQIVIFAGYFIPNYYQDNSTISSGQGVYNQMITKTHEVEQLNQIIGSLSSKQSSLNTANVEESKSNFVTLLPSLLPVGVELSNMALDNSKIRIEGYALNPGGVQIFLSNLTSSELIKSPTLKLNSPEGGKIAFNIEGPTGLVN
jgi:hypothetical protein